MATTYKIGEAAALLNLKTYVLRFWETEFPAIAPLRTEKGQRLYTEENLALLERIRFLLHERGLTIEGARKVLNEDKEKGVAYVFSAGAATAEEPARGNSPAPEEAVEPAGESAVEEPAALEDEDVFDTPDGSNKALSAAGTAVKKFLSQYNLPGINKSYPIHETPLFERPEPLPEADRRQERPAPSPARREEDGEIRPNGAAFDGESVPPRDRSAARALLRELTAELEDIARLLRADGPRP